MTIKTSCFVAYPSQPPSLAETIEEAVRIIRQLQVVDINGWKSTNVTGKFIITAICQAIESSNVFICDLTTLNHNVLFELGFAIAKKKRIWILRDINIEKSKIDYEKFRLLTTVGYSSYSNSHEIANIFYQERPYEDLESTIYKDTIESIINRYEKPTLLYLKSGIETNASIKLSRRVEKSKIPRIIDDPKEVGIQPLTWYAQRVHSAHAVIAHFLSQAQTGWLFHNAKNSFVAGLAYGFGKHLMMLAHEPYDSPIDYQDLLKTHNTASQCESLANSWLNEIEYSFTSRIVTTEEYAEELRAQSELQQIEIGDPIAEHESETLRKYFVRTATYTAALAAQHSIFVGRKGSGKTAILYKLADEIGSNLRNHVCIIKPVAYELDGIVHMLQQALAISEKGYLIESFWKFLIYTELAKSLYENLKSKPAYYHPDEIEQALLKLVEENASNITPDFSIRLESTVNKLKDVSLVQSASNQRIKISELLHEEIIAKIRTVLGMVLEKKSKVIILVDNLDKAWNAQKELTSLSQLLLGLLAVSPRISLDFQRASHGRRSVNLSLIIFLRSDIFAQIIKHAPERDKISYSRITWDDPEILLQVLEERFLVSSTLTNSSEVWSRFFCATVKGVSTREYLTKCILPRPRDLIYLDRAAITNAINHRHIKIEETDILEAQKKYSQYALDSIIVENSIPVEILEELLYEFVGGPDVINRDDILKAMNKCDISHGDLDKIIELLCDLTFLGREVECDRFEFQYNDDYKMKLQVMARKTAETRMDKLERYRINEAFHAYLEIK